MINLTKKNPEAINDNDLMNISGGGAVEYTLNFIIGVLFGTISPISTMVKSKKKFKDFPGMSTGITISSIILMVISGYEVCKGVNWSYIKSKELINKYKII